MSASSCNNVLTGDPELAAGFLVRQQNKLMFGCDCSCLDGHGAVAERQGGAAPPAAGAPAPRLAGKCIARETLTALKRLAQPDVFRKITWENGNRLLKL